MQLHTNTTSPLLQQTLMTLMKLPQLSDFRLTNGTAFSYLFGHRISKEIDLYSNESFTPELGEKLKITIINNFGKGEQHVVEALGNGSSFFIYNLNKDYVKIDIYYSESRFLEEPVTKDYLRMASELDLMVHKLDRIFRFPAKSDYWDMHMLMGKYTFSQLWEMYEMRFGTERTFKQAQKDVLRFDKVEDDFAPQCLLKKDWNIIKLDWIDWVNA